MVSEMCIRDSKCHHAGQQQGAAAGEGAAAHTPAGEQDESGQNTAGQLKGGESANEEPRGDAVFRRRQDAFERGI